MKRKPKISLLDAASNKLSSEISPFAVHAVRIARAMERAVDELQVLCFAGEHCHAAIDLVLINQLRHDLRHATDTTNQLIRNTLNVVYNGYEKQYAEWWGSGKCAEQYNIRPALPHLPYFGDGVEVSA